MNSVLPVGILEQLICFWEKVLLILPKLASNLPSACFSFEFHLTLRGRNSLELWSFIIYWSSMGLRHCIQCLENWGIPTPSVVEELWLWLWREYRFSPIQRILCLEKERDGSAVKSTGCPCRELHEILNTHMAAHNLCNSSPRGSSAFLWLL